MARVLMPVPETGFDPSESAIPWKLVTDAGHEVVFATNTGKPGACDPIPLAGSLFLQPISADSYVRAAYEAMSDHPNFKAPLAWKDIDASAFDGLILVGGEGVGMVEYCRSIELPPKIAPFFLEEKPIAALCHGVIIAANAKDPRTGKSVLARRKTTTLPKFMERVGRIGFFMAGRPAIYDFYAEDVVRAALDSQEQFVRGPLSLAKGTLTDDRHAHVVEDGNYVSSRWPGDAYGMTRAFLRKLSAAGSVRTAAAG